jgi:DNA gyrase subunit B
MSVLKEYLNFFDKVNKRLRDESVAELLPRMDFSKHADFEGDKKNPPKKIERLERELKKLAKDRKFKSVESSFDEEHNLWEVRFVSSQGSEHVINWELASSAEFRQLISKFKQIEPYLEPPFVVEAIVKSAAASKEEDADEESAESEEKSDKESVKAAPGSKSRAVIEPVEKATARELFEYVKKEGSRGYDVQRYKGLGEMTAPQLWETTMDPERRTLLSVKLEDIAECETIFTTLMGEDVEARRKFIEENALDVKNLDI